MADNLLNISIPKQVENLQLPDPTLLFYYQNLEKRIFWLDEEVSDYTVDVSLGLKQLLKVVFQRISNLQVQESYQKIRNTNRYLLSNLNDFNPTTDKIPYSQLHLPDKWCLSRLYEVDKEVRTAYDRFSFTDV